MWKNIIAIVVIGLVLGLIWPNYFKSKTSELEKQAAQDREKEHEVSKIELQDQIETITKEFTTCQNQLEDSSAHNQKHKDEISKLQDQIKATKKEFANCQNLLENSSDHNRKFQDQNKATTKEFATCQNLLEECNAHGQKFKDEINKLQDQIKAITKEFATSQKLLEDCNADGQELKILKDEIDQLQDQIKVSGKEFATCQSLLGDCNARTHISHEKSSDRLYNIVLCGMLLMVLCLCGVGYTSRYSYGHHSPLHLRRSNDCVIAYRE